MATIDRIDPAYTAWTPSASGFATENDEEYVGRHRLPQPRRARFTLSALFFAGRHRRRRRR